jgi:sensor histidine kinase YesM
MRMILDNSRQEWVLLESEIRALQLYIELEAVRLKNSFSYSICIEPDVKSSVIMVPPMIMQPYVENAIWHGLLHRTQTGGMLQLHLLQEDEILYIKIEDNGIGRDEAIKLRSRFDSHKKSHGMKITAERLDIINKTYNTDIRVSVTDIMNGDSVAGTRVLIMLKNILNDRHNRR